MTRVAFAIPGDIDTPTGGYRYDREVLARLPDFGVSVVHHPLPPGFPDVSDGDLTRCEQALARSDRDAVLLIDGLAYGAFPETTVRGLGRPIVALVHHPLALESGTPPERARALKASETAALALADAVVATSETTAMTLSADYHVPRAKLTVAEPGVLESPRARGSSEGAPVLLSVGAVSARKGYDVLIEALGRIADLPWRMNVVGATDRAPDVFAALSDLLATSPIADRLRFLGALDDAAVASAYDRADLFVMPSRYEGYGMVVTEALARGLPIVSTTGGALAEVVPEAAAVKVAPDDADAFAGGLRRMLARPEFRTAKADAAWTLASELPRWSDTARIVADVLRRVDRTRRTG